MNKRSFRILLLATVFLLSILATSHVQVVSATPDYEDDGDGPYDNEVLSP